MVIDPELYSNLTTKWSRVRRPRSLLPCPFRAQVSDGWHCKDFVDVLGRRFQRRRRRGRTGMMERWFLMTGFEAEVVKPKKPDCDEAKSPPPTSDEFEIIAMAFTLNNMAWDFLDELDFGCELKIDGEALELLHRVRSLVTECRLLIRQLHRGALKPAGWEMTTMIQ